MVEQTVVDALKKEVTDLREIRRVTNKENIELKREIHRRSDDRMTAEKVRKEIFNIAEYSPEPPAWLNKEPGKSSTGIPLICVNDWHWGEYVDPDQVGGVNKFNRAIAKERVRVLHDTVVDLCFNHMTNPNYPGAVVAVLGDMITGNIHEDLAMTNDGPVMWSVNEVENQLIGLIKSWKKRFGKIAVICVPGNHGRNTVKPRINNRVYECLGVETPTLTRDLRWVPGGELSLGSDLLAFDDLPPSVVGRRYVDGRVTRFERLMAPTVKITLSDGTVFFATREHRFLAYFGEHNASVRWLSAEDMLTYWGKGNKMELANYLPVWHEDRSYEGGFLAAAFDGEGSLCHSGKHEDGETFGYQLSYNQKDNQMLAAVKTYLTQFGFDFSDSPDSEGKHNITIKGGFTEICRFLGTFRPPRLLAKWMSMDVSRKFLECKSGHRIAVVGVEDGGEHEIASMSTSAGTYFSGGFGSHNSYEWLIYCHIEQYFRGDPNVSVYVPNEVDAHFSIYGHRIMATHGDTLGVKGGDGLIGALGPIARGAMKIGAQQRQVGRDFDTLLVGHYHFYMPRGDATPVLMSSALMGYNTYAHLQLRVRASRPSQALSFIHHKHGFTAQWPMYLDKKVLAPKREPWFVWGGARTNRDLDLG